MDQIIKGYVPTKKFDIFDSAFDALGILLAYYESYLQKKYCLSNIRKKGQIKINESICR